MRLEHRSPVFPPTRKTGFSQLARWLLRHRSLVLVLASLIALVGLWRTAATYRALRSELEELLPTTAPSVLAFDQARHVWACGASTLVHPPPELEHRVSWVNHIRERHQQRHHAARALPRRAHPRSRLSASHLHDGVDHLETNPRRSRGSGRSVWLPRVHRLPRLRPVRVDRRHRHDRLLDLGQRSRSRNCPCGWFALSPCPCMSS